MTTNMETKVADVSIKLNGSLISSDLYRQLNEVEVENNLYLPDSCTLRFELESLEGKELSTVDNTFKNYLSQGTELVVAHLDNNTETKIFEGDITSISLEFSSIMPSDPMLAVVQGYDKSHKLHKGRKTRTFLQMGIADIVNTIASDANMVPNVSSPSVRLDYVIQANQTDWEFLWQLANRVGYEVHVSGKDLYFVEPQQSRSSVDLKWGVDLQQFHMRASTSLQSPQVSVRGWDWINKEPISARVSSGTGLTDLNSFPDGTQAANSAFGTSEFAVVNSPVNTDSEAEAMAQSLSDAMSSAFVEAEGVAARGSGNIIPGSKLSVTDIGARSGDYYVTATTHRFSHLEGYISSFSVGAPNTQTLAGQLHGNENISGRIQGVVVGIVTDNNDPDDLSRVKVQFPWLGDQIESDWARIAAPGAGPTRGMHWLPEVDDEVLVVFEHGDMHRPYILGGLWSTPDAPPKNNSEVVDSDGLVNLRGITSREGLNFTISDESGQNTIGIYNQDDDSKIVIKHDDKEIEILSNGDINVTALGDINVAADQGKITVQGQDIEIKSATNMLLEATGNIEMKATGNTTIKGAQVSVQGQAMTEIKAPQTSVQGQAMTEIKGGLVKIN